MYIPTVCLAFAHLLHKIGKLASLLLPLLIYAACGGGASVNPYSEAERKAIDSVLLSNRDCDTLLAAAQQYAAEGNAYGEMAAYRELGKRYREESRFAEAIEAHKQGLQRAVEQCDTIQIIQALNNIGTNFRRMGILDEASSYHYQALAYSDAYSDKESFAARKNRVVSLNGIGNVHLSLDNRETADSVFRLALAGEHALSSALGQAINCANIGALFEADGRLDSAKYYYARSMQFNREANSPLGISLCHTHFGRLYEKEHRLDSAAASYRRAYDLMTQKGDAWHWLEACLALARVNVEKGDLARAAVYLDSARHTAEAMPSLEHLAEAYRLEYLLHDRRGDCRAALACFVKSRQYADSVQSEKNVNHMQNVRISYERSRKQSEMELMRLNYEKEETIRTVTLICFIIGFLLACTAIGFLLYAGRMRARRQKIMKETEQMRTNFFTNITHEFRTPLTIIHSAAGEVMRLAPPDSEIHSDAAAIVRSEQGLLRLINQILDIAKMTAGAPMQKVVWKHGDIVPLIRSIAETHVVYAAAAGIKLTFAPQEAQVMMDYVGDYVQKIVQNLLSNAIKFTAPGGEIYLSTRIDRRNFVLHVSDTGIGFTPEQKEHIFKPFYQASNDTQGIGTGIGLSIVSLSVEKMKGTIEVHSAPGEGSVFTVTLPLAAKGEVIAEYEPDPLPDALPLPEADAAMTEPPADDGDAETDGTHVLIVEDTPEVAHYMKRQFPAAAGYRFHFAADGEEALAKARQLVPDLIITDVMMPRMDGFELCRRVRADELVCHVPVIMVTARATHEDRLQGLQAGADAYLEKPFHSDELTLRAAKLLEQRELLRRKYSEAVAGGGDPQSAVLREGDKAFVEKVTDAVHAAISNGKGKIDYDALAYTLCLSRAQLNRKVKAVTGYTTTDFILQIRISMAKQYLDRSNLTIWEIALRCGMDSDSYFCTLFKKCTGMTPLQYKNREK